jgi:hypothetical protein
VVAWKLLGTPVIEPSVLSVKPSGRSVEHEKVAVTGASLLSSTVGASIVAADSCVKVKEV